MNLTSVRDPDEIVRRHFGESLFAARCLFPEVGEQSSLKIIDVGSGAGFPGIPIKLWFRTAKVTLIEANHKKVAFLRELIRTLTLMDIDVFHGRAEDYKGPLGAVVTLRAVERFDAILPTAARLMAEGGRLALLIGESQYHRAAELEASLGWEPLVKIPGSLSRILAVANANHTC